MMDPSSFDASRDIWIPTPLIGIKRQWNKELQKWLDTKPVGRRHIYKANKHRVTEMSLQYVDQSGDYSEQWMPNLMNNKHITY